MAIQIQQSIQIDRPVSQVRAYLADLRNEPQYWEGVKTMTLVAGEPGQVGSRYQRVFNAMGRDQTTTMEIVEVGSNRMVARSGPGPVHVTGTMSFEALPGATRLDLQLDAQPHGWMARLFQRKIRKGMEQNTTTSLQRLKSV